MVILSSEAHNASICCTCCWLDSTFECCATVVQSHTVLAASSPDSWVYKAVQSSRCLLRPLLWQRPAGHRPRGFAKAVNNHRSRLLSHCSLIHDCVSSDPPSTSPHHQCSSARRHSPFKVWAQLRESLPSLNLSHCMSQSCCELPI